MRQARLLKIFFIQPESLFKQKNAFSCTATLATRILTPIAPGYILVINQKFSQVARFFIPLDMFQVMVLLCGTNNHSHTAHEVAGGIKALIETARDKQPAAFIIVCVSKTLVCTFVIFNNFLMKTGKQIGSL